MNKRLINLIESAGLSLTLAGALWAGHNTLKQYEAGISEKIVARDQYFRNEDKMVRWNDLYDCERNQFRGIGAAAIGLGLFTLGSRKRYQTALNQIQQI